LELDLDFPEVEIVKHGFLPLRSHLLQKSEGVAKRDLPFPAEHSGKVVSSAQREHGDGDLTQSDVVLEQNLNCLGSTAVTTSNDHSDDLGELPFLHHLVGFLGLLGVENVDQVDLVLVFELDVFDAEIDESLALEAAAFLVYEAEVNYREFFLSFGLLGLVSQHNVVEARF